MLPAIPTVFTPWASLLGGVLIGLSAVMLMLFFGRIAGISGITASLFSETTSDWQWRVQFVIGLVLAPLLVTVITGERIVQNVSSNVVGMIVAGLFVGVGVTLGSGCTSGHGVCGLARLSARSLVSVLVFLLVAVITVFAIRHVFN